MKNFDKKKKTLLYYYGIAMIILLLFNFIAMPQISEMQIAEVDYGTFMTMIEKSRLDLWKYRTTRFSLRTKRMKTFTKPVLCRITI